MNENINVNEQKIMNLLGMAQKAGKIISGDFVVTKALSDEKKCKVKLLIVAEDATEETFKKMVGLIGQRNIELRRALTKENLGHCIGKEYRATAAVIDDGFAKALLKLLKGDK